MTLWSLLIATWFASQTYLLVTPPRRGQRDATRPQRAGRHVATRRGRRAATCHDATRATR